MSGKHAKPKTGRGRKAALTAAVGVGAALPWTASAATLTPAQIASTARQGCPQLDTHGIDTAVRIAEAESGGNPDAHNPNGEDSRGLWQINVAAHGSPWGDLYDPVTNARAMCDISGGGSHWGDWTTYTSGAYLNRPGWSGSVPSTPSAPVTPPVRPSVSSSPHSGWRYTVRSGDTLWTISPGHDWKPVYERNRAVIGDNPDLIYPGQVLK